MLGLLSDLPRKNCWTIAEWAGESTPDGMQHLHDDRAVLVVDETGDVKKGTGTVGVQRHYTGTAGRIENAQVAVYLVYAGRRGHAAVDRELYVPRSWTSDPDRCRDGRTRPGEVALGTARGLAGAFFLAASICSPS